ncbi:MAG: hypothetical protein ACI9R3_002869 [Verrucomicrobiales bacterium]
MIRKRVVVPEILDGLAADDPAALRSRCDLRLINFLMGNERWIARKVQSFSEAAGKGIVEIGAGEGKMLQKLQCFSPLGAQLTGVDIAARPAQLPSAIQWQSADIFDVLDSLSGGVLIACLFLHHFTDSQLIRLASVMPRFDVVCFVEPLRRRRSLVAGSLLLPFVNHVTRHDMPVSIRAGFERNELSSLLGLTSPGWNCRETPSFLGGLRISATAATARNH